MKTNTAILHFGTIAAIDPTKGLARVNLDEDGIVTPFLSFANQVTKDGQIYTTPAIGEQVAVLLTADGINGVIVGALYSETDQAGATAGDFTVSLPGGFTATYNTGTQQFSVTAGTLELVLNPGGNSITLGGASDSLGAILRDLVDQILLETHNAAGVPTTPPLNAAAYTLIKNRITALLG